MPVSAELVPGETCWRSAPEHRVAFLIDNDAYYRALHDALRNARRSILILGWAFDPRTRLAPDGGESPDDPDEIGSVLTELARVRPELDVRILVWKSTLSMNGSHDFLPHRATSRFRGAGVRFRLDGTAPFGACHHQKVVVIDDRLAFCGGGDIVTNRWDTRAHLDGDPRRILPHHAFHPPRHEVTIMIDGPCARTLGELFRGRWRAATGETMIAPDACESDPWPAAVHPQMSNAEVGVSRTLPAARDHPTVDEIRKMMLACIAGARRTIYLESQYFTSALIAEALAARLREPDGPEVVLIVPGHAPSWFDRLTMDGVRNFMVRRLCEADLHGRFRAYWPATAKGRPIIVHSKVSIFDDRIVRVGSANLNNRSGGFDSECDLAVAAATQGQQRAIALFRDALICHYLDSPPEALVQARQEHGSLGSAIDALNNAGRLVPINPARPAALGSFVAALHLGDPRDVSDNWRPGRRSGPPS